MVLLDPNTKVKLILGGIDPSVLVGDRIGAGTELGVARRSTCDVDLTLVVEVGGQLHDPLGAHEWNSFFRFGPAEWARLLAPHSYHPVAPH